MVPAPASALPGRAARLADFQGTVWLFDVAQGRWEEGLRNRALTGGDRLATGADGRAELRVGSTELRLAPRTELEIVDLGDDRLVWQLVAGSLAWRVQRHEIARESEVRAGGVRLQADGPGHFRLDAEGAVVWASAWRGSLRADTGDQLVRIPTGRRAEFLRPTAGSATAVTWSVPVPDTFSDWVARDEQRDDQLARTAVAYVSPEMTGVEELDRHGRWERHPEFGPVWTPLAVAAGWEPFRDGRWVWHARWGWTWVDAAPWGFAPFHHGRWVTWAGRWCWVPGPYVARPRFSPALVTWSGPASSGVSVSVTLGPAWHGRHWAPLPPRPVPHPPRLAPVLPPPAPVSTGPAPTPPRLAPVPPPGDAPAHHVRPPRPPGQVLLPQAPPLAAPPPAPVRGAMPEPPAPAAQAPRPEPPARGAGPDDRARPRPPARPGPGDTTGTPAGRARVPEAMGDRPGERQQMQ